MLNFITVTIKKRYRHDLRYRFVASWIHGLTFLYKDSYSWNYFKDSTCILSPFQHLQNIQPFGLGGDVGRGLGAVGATDGADEKRSAKDELRGLETISGTELGVLG